MIINYDVEESKEQDFLFNSYTKVFVGSVTKLFSEALVPPSFFSLRWVGRWNEKEFKFQEKVHGFKGEFLGWKYISNDDSGYQINIYRN